MSVFYSPVFRKAAWYSCSYELLCRGVECIYLLYRNLEHWQFIFSAMTHEIRGVLVEEYANYVNKLRQNVGLEIWIWRQIVTPQTAHIKYKWPSYAIDRTPPYENFLCTPLVLSTFDISVNSYRLRNAWPEISLCVCADGVKSAISQSEISLDTGSTVLKVCVMAHPVIEQNLPEWRVLNLVYHVSAY